MSSSDVTTLTPLGKLSSCNVYQPFPPHFAEQAGSSGEASDVVLEMPGLNVGWHYPDWGFHEFLKSLQANDAMVPRNRTRTASHPHNPIIGIIVFVVN
jgi:hypothetical protein